MLLPNKIRFDGGRLCLDYLNTIHDRYEKPQKDYLHTIDDLINWSFQVGILDSKTCAILEKTTKQETVNAGVFFKEAIKLRKVLYSLIHAIFQRKKIEPIDLEDFNKFVSKSFSRLKIEQRDMKFIESWYLEPNDLRAITYPIIKDAHGLLLSERLHRIGECPKCGWLFLDSSKNGKRRWCSMETCGSRSKAREWYDRNKGYKQ